MGEPKPEELLPPEILRRYAMERYAGLPLPLALAKAAVDVRQAWAILTAEKLDVVLAGVHPEALGTLVDAVVAKMELEGSRKVVIELAWEEDGHMIMRGREG